MSGQRLHNGGCMKKSAWAGAWPRYIGMAIWCLCAWLAYRAMGHPDQSREIFGISLVLNLLTVPALIASWRRQVLTRDH